MKGLKSILVSEQLRPKPGAIPVGGSNPTPPANNTPDPTPTVTSNNTPDPTPTVTSNNTPDPTPTVTRNEETKEVEISQRMAEMFDVFSVFDREGTNYIKKLKDEDREIVKSRVLIRLKRELGNDLENVDMSTVDDTFMNYLITYMVVDKKMDPFYIQYTPDAVYKLTYDLVEVRGLGKVLLEQGFNTDTEKVYIQYTDGDNFKFVGGPGGKNAATVTYNRRTGQPVSGPEEPVKPSGEQPSQNKSSEPEKRPEEEMGIQNNKLLNDIYKKASAEGIDAVTDLVDKNFTSRQKRIIKSMNGEGYAVLRPINMDMYEVADVKVKYGEDFKDFTEFKMYKPKTSNVSVGERANSLSELSKLQNITKGQCKELIEQYYEMGKVGDVDISDEELKNAARQVYRCRRQHKFGGRLDFKNIGEKLDEIGSTKWSQDPESGRFSIDYNNRTVGSSDSGIIDLK